MGGTHYGGSLWFGDASSFARGVTPAFSPSERQRRASRQQSPLSMLSSAWLAVGLRNETGTIELLTPRHAPGGDAPTKEPHFSFLLPLTDENVNLGPGGVGGGVGGDDACSGPGGGGGGE